MMISSDVSTDLFMLEKILEEAKAHLGEDSRIYVTFSNENGRVETDLLRSKAFEGWLWKEFLDRASKQLSPALRTKALERFERDFLSKRPVHARVAHRCYAQEDECWFDLGDNNIVYIDKDGWRTQDIADCVDLPLFRTNPARLAISKVESAGCLDGLKKLLGFDDDQISLALIWLLCCLRGPGPYPVLALTGGNNSLRVRALRDLIDPQIQGPLPPPSSEQALAELADANFATALCDIETLSPIQAQTIAHIAKGYSIVAYERTSPKITFTGARPLLLAGSEDMLQHHALSSCALVIDTRGQNDHIETVWMLNGLIDEIRSRILGGLFDIVRDALRHRVGPRKEINSDPFERWLTACEKGTPSLGNRLTEAYRQNQTVLRDEVLDDNPLFATLRDVMQEQNSFQGTARELLQMLDKAVIGTKGGQWPKSEEQLAKALRRNTAFFPEMEFRFGERKGKKRERQIGIAMRQSESPAVEDGAAPPQQSASKLPPQPATKRPAKSDGQTSLFG